MKFTCVCLVVLLITIAMISIAAGDKFLGIDWDKVDPACTASCAFYNYCLISGKVGCERPSKCDCSEFA